jgi:hypothetical protein
MTDLTYQALLLAFCHAEHISVSKRKCINVPHYKLLCILRVRRTSKLSAPHVLENPKAHIKVHKTGIKLASSSSLPLTSDQVPQSSNGHCMMSFVSLSDCLKEEV